LGVDFQGEFIRIQVKSAWFNTKDKCYIVDARRTKTNRRRMLRAHYRKNDFDFAIVYIADSNVFYVMPIAAFSGYKSTIHLLNQKSGSVGQKQRFTESDGICYPMGPSVGND